MSAQTARSNSLDSHIPRSQDHSPKPQGPDVPNPKSEPDQQRDPKSAVQHVSDMKAPFTYNLFDPAISRERIAFIKMIIMGVVMTSVVVLSFLSIYWGSLFKTPQHVHKLKGIVVDFDQGPIGAAVIQAYMDSTGEAHQVDWVFMNASSYDGPDAVAGAILAQDYWAAIVVHRSASDKLASAVASRDSTYNSSSAVTVYVTEARNDNAVASFILPAIRLGMQSAQNAFATSHARSQADTANLAALLRVAPQTITDPLGYTVQDLRPFDIPVAQAAVFVGLIYLVVISFILTLLNFNARMGSGLYQKLDLRSLLIVRLVTPLFMYFWLSWVYSFINLIFEVPFDRYVGRGGFLIFWAMSFLGMAALGMASESLITILTPRFIPFFLILWLISNISISSLPIEMLDPVFRYGYAMPFHNMSQTVRTILFDTKQEFGLNFGVQLGWIALSVMTLSLFQFYKRRQEKLPLHKKKPDPV